MKNLTKYALKGVLARYTGLLVEFLTFNFFNTIFFYVFWASPHIILRLIYFVLLAVNLKIEHITSSKFMIKYTTPIPAQAIMQQKHKYIFFIGFYFIAYLGARSSMPDSLFINYTTTCLVGYLVAWIIFIKSKKHIPIPQNNDNKNKKDKTKK